MTKVYFHWSSVNPFSSIFSKWPLYYHLTLRGHNLTLALRTVLKLNVRLKLLGCSVWLWSQWFKVLPFRLLGVVTRERERGGEGGEMERDSVCACVRACVQKELICESLRVPLIRFFGAVQIAFIIFVWIAQDEQTDTFSLFCPSGSHNYFWILVTMVTVQLSNQNTTRG